MRILCLAIALGVLALACKKSEPPAPSAPAAEPSAAPAAPVAPPSAAPSAAPSADAPSAGGLTWKAPPPFLARTPKSSMRVAEYGLEGDESAELSVFYFGSDQGGSVEANMTRWIGQFTQPDGSQTQSKRSERTVKGIDVSVVEAQGTYSGGMGMPGAPQKAAVNDAMLLGAIAKGPQGAVFFKLTGPRAAIEHAKAGFDGLLESIQPAH
ncbi:MAG TPA: hypothetical protein VJV78_18800 [Polyangiales bacterium]|nr:hypothetical protein [Polyangiales bacterium]